MRHKPAVALTLLFACVTLADTVPVAPRETGPSADSNLRPIVVPSGNEFVVLWWASGVWQFARIRHADEVLLTGTIAAGSVENAIAGPNGSVLAAIRQDDGIHIATIATGGNVSVSGRVANSFSSMASNGSRILIVTEEGHPIVTDAQGHDLGSGPEVMLDTDQISAASARGNGFIVAWPERNGYGLLTLTNAADVVREQHFDQERQYGRLNIGCNPSGACLLLTSMRQRLSGQLLGNDTDPEGAIVPISEDLVAEALPPVWDGQRFLVAWNDYTFTDRNMFTKVRVEAFALNGSVTHVAQLEAADRQVEEAAIAAANGETVIVWSEALHCGWGGRQIVARSLLTNHEIRLTHGLSQQRSPAVAAGDSDALIAWTETGGTARIRARKYPFTEPAFEVSPGPSSGSPVVATDGRSYLVAWLEAKASEDCADELRVSLAGSGEIHTLGSNVAAVTMTWNGSEYAVVWEQANPARLFAMRVDRDGRPIDNEPVSLSSPEFDPDPYTTISHTPAALAWTGDGYTLLWRRSRLVYIPLYPYPPAPQFDARITRLAPNLVLTETKSIANAYDVIATRKGDSIVAVWSVAGFLHAFRIAFDGTILRDRNLGLESRLQPRSVVATNTGIAVLLYNEVIDLNDAFTITARRPPAAGLEPKLVETANGPIEVGEAIDSVVVSTIVPSPVEPRRRRSMR